MARLLAWTSLARDAPKARRRAQFGGVYRQPRSATESRSEMRVIPTQAASCGHDMRDEGSYRQRHRRSIGQFSIRYYLRPVQIDIGFSDAVVPPAEWVEFPAPHLRAYPPEATIAEKLHAMALLEARNSRTKDLFDVWMLASHREFEGLRLCKAIAATFERRQTPVPSEPPVALTEAFAEEPDQLARWHAFMNRLGRSAVGWGEVLAVIRDFLGPPCAAVAAGERFDGVWSPGGPWS